MAVVLQAMGPRATRRPAVINTVDYQLIGN
jgi:hypothetical protein